MTSLSTPPTTAVAAASAAPAVDLQNVTFFYPNSRYPTLANLSLQLPSSGSLTLLLGSNGSGKSTLLKIIAGRHLVKCGTPEDPYADGHARVLGKHAYRDLSLNLCRAHADTDWGKSSTPFGGGGGGGLLYMDVEVGDMMKKEQEMFKERRDEIKDMVSGCLYISRTL